MDEIKIIEGGISVDERGSISHANGFDMNDIKRFYVIYQNDTSVIRAWHGHQFEKKYFFAVKGSFIMAFVKIDNWENPSEFLQPSIFMLSDAKSEVICLPEGFASGIKANEPDSILIVFSNKTLSDATGDSWRYDKDLWIDWSKYE
ncbi:WxcM-like domain-containing protein [uncultured Acetobacteroides sp.]|uniref:WxcM-like domain-containing protein n=1 Tax=uncultured Acetobacteroides sp. TaxID=1760811 RepID=UPI0029F4C21B|nr:WxcM-like domain-containing protein [uncultured Acetobacteroides sp.]